MTKSKKVENQKSTTETTLNWVKELSKKEAELSEKCYKKEGKAAIILAADSELSTGYNGIFGDPGTIVGLLRHAMLKCEHFKEAVAVALDECTQLQTPVTEPEEKPETETPKEQEEIPEWQKAATDFYKKAGNTLGNGKDDKGFLLVAADMPNKKATMQIGGDARTIAFMLRNAMKDNPELLERMETAIARARLESILGA